MDVKNPRKAEWKLWGRIAPDQGIILITRGTLAHCRRELEYRSKHASATDMVVRHESESRPA